MTSSSGSVFSLVLPILRGRSCGTEARVCLWIARPSNIWDTPSGCPGMSAYDARDVYTGEPTSFVRAHISFCRAWLTSIGVVTASKECVVHNYILQKELCKYLLFGFCLKFDNCVLMCSLLITSGIQIHVCASYRFTEWRLWNGTALYPDMRDEAVIGIELYSHPLHTGTISTHPRRGYTHTPWGTYV